MTLYFPDIPLPSIIIFFIVMASMFSAHLPIAFIFSHHLTVQSFPVAQPVFSVLCHTHNRQLSHSLYFLHSPSCSILAPGPIAIETLLLTRNPDCQSSGHLILSTTFPFLSSPQTISNSETSLRLPPKIQLINLMPLSQFLTLTSRKYRCHSIVACGQRATPWLRASIRDINSCMT